MPIISQDGLWDWVRRIGRLILAGLILLVPSLAIAADTAGPRTLSWSERVEGRKAIEEVYYRHRTWPVRNPEVKPGFATLVDLQQLEVREEDETLQGQALAVLWNRPITSRNLRAEIERIVRQSRNPKMMEEIFAALDHDPVLIAECLARPHLARRFLRNAFFEARSLHREVRERAERVVVGGVRPEDLRNLDGQVTETVWRKGDHPPVRLQHGERDGLYQIGLSRSDWSDLVRSLAGAFPQPEEKPAHPQLGANDSFWIERIPIGQVSPLREDREGWSVVAVLVKEPSMIRAIQVRWNRRTFDDWWRETRPSFSLSSALGAEKSLTPADAAAISTLVAAFGNRVTAAGKTCDDDTWTSIYPGAPEARQYHTAVWTGSEMIVWGGSAWTSTYGSGARYDPATDTWTEVSNSQAPSPRQQHSAVWTGTEMIIWGGYDGGSPYLNTGGRYNPVADTWVPTSTGSGCPSPRYWHPAVWTGTEMIIWGGTGVDYEVDTGGRYNPTTDSWIPTSKAGTAPEARFAHTAVWTGSEMIIWGGAAMNPPPVWTPGARYDPVQDLWRPINPNGAPTAGAGHAAFWTGSEMLIWGGDASTSGARYRPVQDIWIPISKTNAPAPRSEFSAVWTGLEMIVWGGDIGGPARPERWTNTGARYLLAYNAWIPLPVTDSTPSGRFRATAVWDGEEMIVWGGNTPQPNADHDTGGRYRPLYDDWTPTAVASGLPAGRVGHSTVWTGAEMIVWGGNTPSWDSTNSGFRYDPALNDWTFTSLGDGTPSPRYRAPAVWTGSEMMFWGGFSLSTGWPADWGRYRVADDSWIPTTPVPFLSPRSSHTAVWTGSEMIVWGGSDNVGSVRNDGGRFSPVTTAWAPTGIDLKTPSARYEHSAVWTGRQMIVWGGVTASEQFTRTGGRYRPATDAWKKTPVGKNTPHARRGMSVVWTGKEMIIWGGDWWLGEAEYRIFNNGAAYLPRTGRWNPLPLTAETPDPRGAASAIWTGKEMIVWGGYGVYFGAIDSRTGGRYYLEKDAWKPTSTGPHVPPGGAGHSAVWTGEQMIIWGGAPVTAAGGLYCVSSQNSIWYHDVDGDGYGGASGMIEAQIQPPGYSAYSDDCNDSDPLVNPEEGDVCDGMDNDCEGHQDGPEPGPVDPLWVSTDQEGTFISWPALRGVVTNDLIRGTLGQLAGQQGDFSKSVDLCLVNDLDDEQYIDGDNPSVEDGFWYLVRAGNCAGPGTYNSGGPRQAADRDPGIAMSPNACP